MTKDRAERLQRIAEEMGALTKQIGPSLIRLAHLRQEAQRILAEDGIPLEETDVPAQ